MFDKLFLTVLKSKWTWIALAVIALGVYVYGVIQENRELRAANAVSHQNAVALQDSISKLKDSVQVLAIKVWNIQSESGELEGKYIAVNTKYELALKEINVWKKEADSLRIVGDSLVTVDFSGKQDIATYKGSTEANIKSKAKTHTLKISFSEIDATAALFYDPVDSLWKMRTLSLSPGITLRGVTTVDDDTYRKIQGLKPIEVRPPHTFGIGGLFAYDRVYAGVVLTPSQWMFSAHYKIFDKYLTGENWSDKLMIGVSYYIW